METLTRQGFLLLFLSIFCGIGNGAKLLPYSAFTNNEADMAASSFTSENTVTESTIINPTISTEITPKPSTEVLSSSTIETISTPTTTEALSSSTIEIMPTPTTIEVPSSSTIETIPTPTSTEIPSSSTIVTTPKPTITEAPSSTVVTTPKPTSTEAPSTTIVTTAKPTSTEAPSSTVVTTPKPTTTEAPSTTIVTTPKPTTTEAPSTTIVTTPKPTTTEGPSTTIVTTPKPTTTEAPSTTIVTTPKPTTTEAPSTTILTTPKPTTTEAPSTTIVTSPKPTTTEAPSTTIVTTPKPTTTEAPSTTIVTTPKPTTTEAPSTTIVTTPKPTSSEAPSTTIVTTPKPTITEAPSTTIWTTPKPTTTASPSPTPTETTSQPTTTTVLPTTTEEPISTEQKPCILRDYGYNSYVCVCNATYCDTIPPIEPLPEGEYEIYSSNRVGRRFFKEHGNFKPNVDDDPLPALIYVNPEVRYQTISGFGSAITDASGININSLKSGARRNLLRSYYSKAGIEYSLVQVPIGSTDFSTHPYTYDDGKEDPELKNFKLAPEDKNVKIPLIKEAQALQNDLTLLASPWAAPAWMKSNGAIGGAGILKSAMYQPWANYLIKFLEAYEEYDLGFWGITTGNQPNQGRESTPIPSLGWLASQQGVWVAKNLGPTLESSAFKDINVLAVDDKRNHFPVYADLMFLSNAIARQYVDGFGVQWQDNEKTPSSVLTDTHKKYEDKIILTTAARAVSSTPASNGVPLGVWDHAEQYIRNIIGDINNWSTGWIDSNLALDLKGGPSFIENHHVEAPIIVNASAEEFYKQPIFYAQGHVSKFVPIGSERIGVTKLLTDIDVTGFIRPDGGIVVVLFNKDIIEQPIQINDIRRGQIHFNAAPRSISTVVYW